jgi:aryl-alcohol dehydrogenase-like predicted oxidoreductase
MQTTRLGGTGLRVSRLCLGMMSYGDPGWRPWILDESAAREHVRAAADAGITFFDTADVYSVGVSEIVTGKLLRECFSRREEYVLATKVRLPMGPGPNDAGLSRGHILDAVAASLRRLGVDHIDLYQIHRWDPDTPIEETMRALHDVVRAGMVRYLGASNLRRAVDLQRARIGVVAVPRRLLPRARTREESAGEGAVRERRDALVSQHREQLQGARAPRRARLTTPGRSSTRGVVNGSPRALQRSLPRTAAPPRNGDRARAWS